MCEDHFKKHFKFCQLCCTIDIIICDSSNSYQKLDNFKVLGCKISVYHLASYSFWGNSSSLNLAIVANSITVFLHIVSAETILFWSQYINVRKLFKGGNYSRAETIWGNTVNMKCSYVWNTFWPKCAPASSFEIINDSVERSHLEKRLSAELISTIIYQEMKPTLSACNSNRFSTLATVHIHKCILRRSHLGQFQGYTNGVLF